MGLAVKTGAAVLNNIVEVKTSSEGLKTKLETNVGNILKNAGTDLVIDGLAQGIAPSSKSVQKVMSKAGFNTGNLCKTVKGIANKLNINVNSEANKTISNTIKKDLKSASNIVSTSLESTFKAGTNNKKDEFKEKTNH